MHIAATQAWPGGFFASYHAYPYYPDFLRAHARATPTRPTPTPPTSATSAATTTARP